MYQGLIHRFTVRPQDRQVKRNRDVGATLGVRDPGPREIRFSAEEQRAGRSWDEHKPRVRRSGARQSGVVAPTRGRPAGENEGFGSSVRSVTASRREAWGWQGRRPSISRNLRPPKIEPLCRGPMRRILPDLKGDAVAYGALPSIELPNSQPIAPACGKTVQRTGRVER